MDKLSIKQVRLAMEFSKEHVASALDVHPNTISNWEEHPDKIPIGKAMALCSVLGIDFKPEYFFGRSATKCC